MGKNSAKAIAARLAAHAAASAQGATNPAPAAPEGATNPEGAAAPETPAAPVKPLSAAAQLKAQMAELQKQLAKLKQEESDAASAERILFADRLAAFLPTVNCADLAEFAERFRAYRTGLKNGTGASRSRATDAEKDAIRELYRKAKAPGATPEEQKWANLSDMAEAKGHSYQNIRNWLIASGDIVPTKRG